MNLASPADENSWIRDVVARFEGPLTLYALRLLGDVEFARDTVQDTFLRLCKQKRNRVETHLAQWLFTVCRNRAMDVRRKEGRMTPLNDTVAKECPSQCAGPMQLAERSDSHTQVMRYLEQLPPRQQEVVRLKFQSGLSYRDISGVTGLSESNVGFLIHTALKTIRQQLADPRPAAANS